MHVSCACEILLSMPKFKVTGWLLFSDLLVGSWLLPYWSHCITDLSSPYRFPNAFSPTALTTLTQIMVFGEKTWAILKITAHFVKLHCCTVNFAKISSLLFQLMYFICFKILKSHTKTLKIRPYFFRSPLKPSSGVHGRTSLGYWIGMLIYICYKECRYVAVCQFSNVAK